MRSIFGRSFWGLAFSHFVVVLILSGSFVFAVQRSIDNWNVSRAQRLQNLLAPVIVRTYRSHGRLQERAIHQAIRPFLSTNMFVYVTNRSDEPVYFYSGGSQVSIHNETVLDERIREVDAHRAMPISILDGSEIIGHLYTDTFGFRYDIANQRMLRTLFAFLGAGLAVSAVFAVGIAYVVSRSLSREAFEVSQRIGLLAQGHRDIAFSNRSATELASIEQSAEILQRRLLTEERLRRRWMEDIAHDLRTPIAGIKAQIEGLTEGYIEFSTAKLEQIQVEFGHIEQLVTDLRELTRMESPESPMSVGEIDADLFVRNLANRYRFRAEEAEIRLEVVSDIDQFCGDEGLLERAAANGLDNALRHVAADGRVALVVSVDQEQEMVEILVKNTGMIDPAAAEHFFERFYRGPGTEGRRGSGLGLSIVQAVAKRHSGEALMRQRGDDTELVIRISRDCSEDQDVESDENR
ncbi:MAG: HAMP domain-containing sensor histidine kinase [Alkalispirochaeta sp.]